MRIRHQPDRWPSHMVVCALTCGNSRQAFASRSVSLIHYADRDLPSKLKIMASSPQQTSILPLNCSCHPVAAELSSCTTTGRRCRLLYCVDLGNGHHFSQSIHNTLQFDASAPASVPDLNPSVIYSITSIALTLLPAISAHSSL